MDSVRFALGAISLLLACSWTLASERAVQLESFVPFGPSAGDTTMHKNDDDFVGPISISTTFPFFNSSYTQVFVNTNGLLSFRNGVNSFNPSPFPLFNIIGLAPFWTDIDTRPGGDIFYREILDAATLNRLSLEVRQVFSELGAFRATWAYVVTWYQVAEYGTPGTFRNTFQTVILTNGYYSFAIYYYNDLQWPPLSGGRQVQAGFNAGDGVNFAILPGSFTSNISLLVQQSNVNSAGKFVFRIDSEIESPDCNPRGFLTILPSVVYFVGGEDISLFGPCFELHDNLQLVIDNRTELSVACNYVNSFEALCRLPFLERVGRLSLKLSINGDNQTFVGSILTRAPFLAKQIDGLQPVYRDDELDQEVGLSWAVRPGQSRPAELYVLQVSQQQLASEQTQSSRQTQTIVHETVLETGMSENRARLNLNEIRAQLEQSASERADSSVFYVGVRNREPIESSRNTQVGQKLVTTRLELLRIVSGTADAYRKCVDWSRNQIIHSLLSNALLPGCPVRAPMRGGTWAEVFFEYTMDARCHPQNAAGCLTLHPGARACYVSNPVAGGRARKCCYDASALLLVGAPNGGSALTFHPNSSPLDHELHDVNGYLFCCVYSNNCHIYYRHRPSDPGIPVIPAWHLFYGDPHFSTLDGLDYTFNAHGEFRLLEIGEIGLSAQVRMLPFRSPQKTDSEGTVFNAIAIRVADTDTFQFEINRLNYLNILVNGELFELSSEFEANESIALNFNGVTLYHSQQVYTLQYENKLVVGVQLAENGKALAFSIRVPDEFNGKTRGLLGVKDGNRGNDLTLPDGTVLTDLDAANDRELFYRFGLPWMVESAAQSVFTYAAGFGYEHYKNPDYTPRFLVDGIHFANEQLFASAQQVCGNDTRCLFDVSLTNDLSMGEFNAQIVQESQATHELIELARRTCVPLNSVLVDGRVTSRSLPEDNYDYEFSCNEGFCLRGAAKIECRQGTLSAALPTCDECKAPAPSSPNKLVFSAEYFKVQYFT